jgi:hypothetical protein
LSDPVSEFAKKGQWKEYKRAVKNKWEVYISEQVDREDATLDVHVDALLMAANRLPIELWIEPELWEAAKERAGSDRQLKATIRSLLKMWVEGGVNPW